MNQRGVVHLVLLLVLLLIVGAVIYALVYFGIIQNPFKNLPLIGNRGPQVELKTDYKNPFKKETQYVNPFDEYKNPFSVNK